MKSSNPVFSRGYAAMATGSDRPATMVSDTLEATFKAPSASSIRTGRMTIEDVVIRTSALFVVLLAAGIFAWNANLGGGVLLGSFLGAFALAMVNTFSKKVRPALAIGYALLEGIAIGIISRMYELTYNGIVHQAIIGTAAAFAGVLFLYSTGRVKVTPQFTRALMGAMVGYLVLGILSIISSFAGVGQGYGLYGVSGLGLLLCLGGVALASFFLIVDFDQISKMIAAGAPREESWRAGFGLMVTVVWLYLEILRLLSILNGRR